MPTNRPFLSNFFAAFRAHSALQKAATSTPSSAPSSAPQTPFTHTAAATTSSLTTTTTNTTSTPRSITTKATQPAANPNPTTTTVAVQASGQFQPTRQHSASPYSRSPGSPGSPAFPLGGPAGSRQRRGSDSSSEGGFREALGAEKWYIGGRTAAGEEHFYKLSMVKRPRSVDRLSLDRLSL